MNKQETRFVLACVALILAMFLSSGIAGASLGPSNRDVLVELRNNNPFSGASQLVLDLEEDFTEDQDAVPYAQVDISFMLDPWYRIYKLSALKMQMTELERDMAMHVPPPGPPGYEYIIAIAFLFGVYGAVLIALDFKSLLTYYRRRRNKE